MTLDEIAGRISKHLFRFERDRTVNEPNPANGIHPYYYARAERAGRYIAVTYVKFHARAHLTRGEAAAYLAALDAGYVGKHDQLRRAG